MTLVCSVGSCREMKGGEGPLISREKDTGSNPGRFFGKRGEGPHRTPKRRRKRKEEREGTVDQSAKHPPMSPGEGGEGGEILP